MARCQLGSKDAPNDGVIHGVVTVNALIAEGDDRPVVRDPLGKVRFKPGETADRLADDLELSLHAGAVLVLTGAEVGTRAGWVAARAFCSIRRCNALRTSLVGFFRSAYRRVRTHSCR